MRLRYLFLLLGTYATVSAGELPIRDGLIMHAEAAAQPSARRRADLPPIGNLQPVDFLIADSSNKVLFSQPSPERRPMLVSDGESAYLKFDGKDDFLGYQALGRSARELTILILAAPKANPGFFTGLVGMGAFGKNDYTSGLNFDFGPAPTPDLSVLNVESVGATGFRDLLTPGFLNAADRPYGDFHVFTVRTKPGKTGTEVFLDGFKGGERERGESTVALDQVVLGGRYYSNDATQPPFAQGCFPGAIAEVAVYERALSDEERSKVEQHLLGKTAALNALLRGTKGHALETIKDPPAVQMFVPGFTVEELPLRIGNLNNVRYRHDGKLVGQGYDGRIYLLTDTNGDGLEDKSEFFWEQRTLVSPIGIALTAKDDPRGDGVFVASKGKVSFILDKDRDGRADEEKVIASGWPQPFHSVDAMGLAVDPKDGSIYFGRGCANFVEAFLIDKATGKSQYRLNDERGTIQRISADFSTREIICTGVRFSCALAFNREGDLFATDQEGATWLPNGNPLDELLHIQRGKHYGFPPRHPRHLPDVIDEPAVFEYGPQHQSTVGMVFNAGVNGGPHFGPAHWKDDALVCGESRGKLYRTKLAKTALGYVAQNHLIASLPMLLVDACVSPSGDLLVACHSGPPDWGTGPAGEGRIFKIRYTGKSVPQPVLAWAAAADEFRVAFDRPLDPADWANVQKKVRIEAGQYAGAGDRFEAIRPGYQVVRDQLGALRKWVDLLGLALSGDRRTLILHVPRQTEALTYAITLPLPEKWKQSGGISQHAEMDVALTLEGIAAAVTAGGKEYHTVLPHGSLKASAELSRGSAEHEAFLQAAAQPDAKLTMRARVNVSNPYVPAVQPGSSLDWDMSKDPFASKKFNVRTDYAGQVESSGTPAEGVFQDIKISGITPRGEAKGLFLTSDDKTTLLPPSRFRLPWASDASASATNVTVARARTDVQGNWLNGRRVFFQDGGCATCHTMRGEGIALGPDLSNLIHRDRESVLRDILEPSATLNPDHPGTLLTLDDGTEHSGLLRSTTADQVVLALPAGAKLDLPRTRVKKLEPMKTSLMPEGIRQQLTGAQMEDLLTFLLLEPIEPAPILRMDPPRPAARKLAEVQSIIASTQDSEKAEKKFHLLLVSGPKDHGPDEHDYPLWLERWSRLLALGDNVVVSTAEAFPAPEQLERADVAVFYNANPGWNAEKAAALDRFHEKGGGAVYIHYAVDGGKDPAGVAERVGLAFTFGSKFRHGEMDLVFTKEHPITKGFPTLHFTDETYWNMRGDTSRLDVLGTVVEEKEPRPQLWTLERRNSRIVGCIPGHYTWTFDDPLFRILVFRSICWAGKQENVDRLAELGTVGAFLGK